MSNTFGRYVLIALTAMTLSACSPQQDANTLAISSQTEGIMVLTVYLPAPGELAQALDLVQRGTTQEISQRPGFIASAIHRNIDETAIFSYSQWKDKAAFDAAEEFIESGQAPLLAKAKTFAAVDSHPYIFVSLHVANQR